MTKFKIILVVLWPILIFNSCASHLTPPHTVKTTSLAWVELGPESRAIARVITDRPTCPLIRIDSQSLAMAVRSAPSDSFPILVCEHGIPSGARGVQVDGQTLPIPRPRMERILVMGDTGCRIKVSNGIKEAQDCNNPNAWPFSKVLKKALEWNPDLIIHVGDYLYREFPCPEGHRGCAGSPYGQNWATWDADFFAPAGGLLQKVPWVFVRGNHELCSRAGEGWFRLLDPRPFSPACQDLTDPYWIDLGQGKVAILDSSSADDFRSKKGQVEQFKSQFKKVTSFGTDIKWLVTHKPVWAIQWPENSTTLSSAAKGKGQNLNMTLQAASEENMPESLDLILTGHIHLFEALSFKDQGPSQLILGNGGTKLAEVPGDLAGMEVGSRRIKSGVAIGEFGYMTMELITSGTWRATAHGVDGNVIQECTVSGPKLSCQVPSK